MANYIVLDLEMCQVPKCCKTKEYHYKNEIIQIGAVKLNDNFEEISRFSTCVKPEYGYVDCFIEKLTGISQEQVSEAPVLKDAMAEFLNWIGSEEAICVSWSTSDSGQFKREMKAKGIGSDKMDSMLETWMDCQDMFDKSVNSNRAWSLEQAIFATGIDAEGRMHDGLMDAVNTASLFRLINTQPDFKLVDVYESMRHEEVEHLSFNIGNLLEGLNLMA